MEALKVEILNPKARKILQELANLNLINISKSIDSKSEFSKIITKIRSKNSVAPSLSDITKEVESSRSERYARKRK